MKAPEAPEKRSRVTKLLLSQVRAHARCRDSVYDEAGNMIETHEQAGEFKEP
jgi:hypothetical protein